LGEHIVRIHRCVEILLKSKGKWGWGRIVKGLRRQKDEREKWKLGATCGLSQVILTINKVIVRHAKCVDKSVS
jgi:hypothetical protein